MPDTKNRINASSGPPSRSSARGSGGRRRCFCGQNDVHLLPFLRKPGIMLQRQQPLRTPGVLADVLREHARVLQQRFRIALLSAILCVHAGLPEFSAGQVRLYSAAQVTVRGDRRALFPGLRGGVSVHP